MILVNNDFSVEIDIKFGELNSVMQWCQRNCESEWGYLVLDSAGEEAGTYKFEFSTETDLINFILWKK